MGKLKCAIENDGFIYCIIDNSNSVTCKIGKIGMKISEEYTLNMLLTRYSTYFPDCKIYKFIRVSDVHNAEIEIFKMLNSIHYKNEHYYFKDQIIINSFNEIKIKYTDINTLIKNSDIITLNKLNKEFRYYNIK